MFLHSVYRFTQLYEVEAGRVKLIYVSLEFTLRMSRDVGLEVHLEKSLGFFNLILIFFSYNSKKALWPVIIVTGSCCLID